MVGGDIRATVRRDELRWEQVLLRGNHMGVERKASGLK